MGTDPIFRKEGLLALGWIVFGTAVTVASWRMDRLENLHINRYEVPGLVPGLLGSAVLVLGVLLALRAIGRGALTAAPRPAGGDRLHTVLVLGAMLLYTVVLVGHGLPFWLVTGVFVTAFIFFFDRDRQTQLGRSTARQLLLALTCGVATSAVISLAFQEIFYVRLP